MVVEVEIVKFFFLVLVRFSGLVATAPILSSNNFPIMAKIGLAAGAAMLLTPTLPALAAPLPEDYLAYGFLALGELAVGMLLGVVMTMFFASIQVAGQVMDMQSGFGLMNVFNPALETQFPIFGFFFFILAVLYLLVLNGHHLMIRALVSTYETIPVGGFVPNRELMWHIARLGAAIFYHGIVIAAPVAAAMFLAYATMGLMGRVVPQIHLFVVGFPITIATALLIVAFATTIYLQYLDEVFTDMFRQVGHVIKGMA